jgi:hypothetical protein
MINKKNNKISKIIKIIIKINNKLSKNQTQLKKIKIQKLLF